MENHQHEHVHEIKSLDSIFIISIVLNLLFVAIEALVGFTQNSLGLLSDLLNAIILLVAVGAIVVESIHKFTHPEAVNGAAVSWTAGAGIVVNGLTAWLLMKSQKKDLNVKGAFLHMAADTLVSVGVVISGLVMMFTGFYLIDPIISIVIAAVILVSTWKLLSQSVRLSLDGIPESVDMDVVRQAIVSDKDVAGMHHVHVWAISTTEIALTAHIVLRPGTDMEAVKERVKSRLSGLGIAHATLEVEFEGTPCHDMHCDCCGGNW